MKQVHKTFSKPQYDFITDTTTKSIAYVGGYGSGKTYALCNKVFYVGKLNTVDSNTVMIVTEPTYDLLMTMLLPMLEDVAKDLGLKTKFNKGLRRLRVFYGKYKADIFLKSLTYPERLVGLNASSVFMDEFDVGSEKKANIAYLNALARIRDAKGAVRQISISTTPEGFKTTYKLFVVNADADSRLIQAKTSDNPKNPPDYIDGMRKRYTDKQIDAYLNGKFVNFTEGNVYAHFDREINTGNFTFTDNETLFLGMDFNHGCCTAVITVLRGSTMYIVDEVIDIKNTFDMADYLKKYPNPIRIYPDASSNQKRSSSVTTDEAILRGAGYAVIKPNSNPSIRDSVNNVNRLFKFSNLFIDNKCVKTIESVEQLAYKNGKPEHNDTYKDGLTDSIRYVTYQVLPPKEMITTIGVHRRPGVF